MTNFSETLPPDPRRPFYAFDQSGQKSLFIIQPLSSNALKIDEQSGDIMQHVPLSDLFKYKSWIFYDEYLSDDVQRIEQELRLKKQRLKLMKRKSLFKELKTGLSELFKI